MTATTRRVAEVAGVSSATVSRVLTDSGPTRTKVLSAAERLGYSPLKTPQRKTPQRAGALGLSVPTLEHPHFASAVTATLRIARRRGWSVFFGDLDERSEDEAALARSMADHVDGLILWSPRLSSELTAELKARVPTVVVNQATCSPPRASPSMPNSFSEREIQH